MTPDRNTSLASALVLVIGIFWGLYWLPLRKLDALGLTGAWGTAAVTVFGCLLLMVPAVRHLGAIRRAGPLVLASLALGGAAFALYSVALVYGRVAMVILLYFLTPVWSTLIGRYIMGWTTPRMRLVAIALGLVELFTMLSANGGVPLPKDSGEWMSLIAGIMWSFATTGIRAKSTLGPIPSAFVFVAGAAIATLFLAPVLEPFPFEVFRTWSLPGLALVTGGLWWALSIALLMWATVRLEPARVGILLMSEVLIGAATAALFAGEHLTGLEIAGGGLVLLAGVLEVWPLRRPRMIQ